MIGFRVDANEQVATGHLMRCIAIAEACKKQGEECLFLLAEEKVTKPLQEHDMPYRILHSKWNELESELDVLRAVLKEEQITYLVVDSYQVTDFYLKQLNEQVPVLYIDDEGEGIYPVSAVLHYSEWQEEYEYQEKYLDTKTVVLSGMQYVPLRQEFSLEVDQKVRENSILITTGGTDPFNICGMLLDCLIKQEDFKQYSFQVIVGSLNQHEDKLQQMAGKDTRIVLHKNVKNMEEFMRQCKFAVSAGGTTLFELCASGIPTVCFSFADNQQRFTEELAQHEIMIYAGDARKRENIAEDIVNGLLCYNKNPHMYFSYAKRMKDLVDGNGASKVAEFLCKKTQKYRI